jgi:hypothetical protein
MKDFWIGLTRKQHRIIDKAKGEFVGREGWGCVANIRCDTGEVHVAMLTPKEMRIFEKAWKAAKAVKP